MVHEEEFYTHLAGAGYRPTTIRLYWHTLRQFEGYLRKAAPVDAREITGSDIRDYQKDMETHRLSLHTIHGRLSRLRCFFAYLEAAGHIFISPMNDYRMPKLIRTHHKALAADEARWILDALKTDTKAAIRGKAILELAYSAALRPREVRNLKLSDIDYRKGLLFIEQSKNRKDRIVPVGATALEAVNRYITDVRVRFIREKTHPFVFINHLTGAQLTASGLQQAVHQTFVDSGMEPIPLYSFRATAATNLLDAGMGVVHISRLLGHSMITTTQGYLHTRRRELTRVLEAYHPRFTKPQEESA